MAPPIPPTIPPAFEALAASLRGEIITPGHPEYEKARIAWNWDHKAKPLAIFRVLGVSDVQKVLKHIFSLPQSTPPVPFTVRGGGHSTRCLCDGYVLDLSKMRSCRVDAQTNTMHVDGGALLNDVYKEAGAYNLMLPAGIVSTTGIGGLSLFGGLGWFSREFGLACDHILEVDLVTADGELRVVNKDKFPDLFWGIRGAGGCFGVITSFRFQLVPSTSVYAGVLGFPLPKAVELYEQLRKVSSSESTYPKNYTAALAMITMQGNKMVGFLSCYHGPEEEGKKLIAPFVQHGPIMHQMAETPTAVWFTSNDALTGFPGNCYMTGLMMESLHPDVIPLLLEAYEHVPCLLSALLVIPFGGKVADIPEDANAFAARNGKYCINIEGRWEKEEDAEPTKQWCRNLANKLAPFRNSTTYINFAQNELPIKGEEYFGTHIGKLKELKAKYDPTNKFRSIAQP